MTSLVGKLVIVRSTTFYDRFLLVQIIKETAQTMNVQAWNKRTSIWADVTRRNDKTVISTISDTVEGLTAKQLNHLADQMESWEANTQERIRKAKKDLTQSMAGARIK